MVYTFPSADSSRHDLHGMLSLNHLVVEFRQGFTQDSDNRAQARLSLSAFRLTSLCECSQTYSVLSSIILAVIPRQYATLSNYIFTFKCA